MSENIRGITFAEQAVTPADDAIVRRAVLGDGALSGCEVTYSGSTLTLAPGFIIACGRAFQITAAQNWAVVDATSGFARLLLTIDLTKTATESTFNQIEFSVEYASAKDGFTELLQDDINISGTKYQIVIAMVSLGTGGITGIVSKLEKAEGGGSGLNFKVVGNPQPTSPSENTIWLNTDVPIASWYFQAEQPENMAEGDVWFPVGTSSTVEFNALKKNGIQVYPLSAKQMVSGALVDKAAKIYQGGQWNTLVNRFYLFKAGEGALVSLKTYKESNSSITVGTDAIVINYSGSINYVTRLRTEEMYDLSRYSKLCMTYTSSKVLSETYALVGVTETAFTSADGSVTFAAQASVSSSNDTKTISVDLRSIDKKMYCGFSLAGTYSITEMWLE